MSRFVHSPLGRTLQAIRDNELRAEALGYRTFVFQLVASSFGSVVATVLGGCYAMWVRYVNPESALGIPIMLDVLLMVIIGGIGTLYGGVVGAAILLTARTLLPNLRGLGGVAVRGLGDPAAARPSAGSSTSAFSSSWWCSSSRAGCWGRCAKRPPDGAGRRPRGRDPFICSAFRVCCA